jgi:Ca2+-binding RTX toxin-like protein
MTDILNLQGAAAMLVANSPVALSDSSGIPQLDANGFLLDPSSPESGLIGTRLNGLAIWSAYQTAAHISQPGGTWADHAPGMNVSYSFGVGATIIPEGYEAFSTQAAQEGALRAMQQYMDVSGVTFHEAEDVNDANITFIFGIGSTNGGGWANYPSAGGGFVQVGHVPYEPQMDAGSYSLRLLMHELGHGLGLAHPGDYNGDTAQYTDADHFNDSRQYTNMSYWNGSYTGANLSHFSTLALHDMLAVQMEYGINWSTRADDTVYGFNATAGNLSYDFSYDNTMAFCIWDGGGNDTLDFSGFVSNAVMDLRQGSFSSTGLETYNVSVAYGAVIENAVGGTGDDRMHGNHAANMMHGGAGDDVIFGGAQTNPVAIIDPRDFTGILLNDAPLTRNQYLSATNIQAFSGGAFTIEMQVQLERSPANTIAFASYAVSGGDNELLIDGINKGNLKITIRGVSYTTSIATEELIDGMAHRLSVTWDKATGVLNTYIDGVLEDTGVLQLGVSIRVGGTLVFGQEQDSVGGGFSTNQIFQGTIGDIRTFDHVRTAQEIADSAFLDLSGTEQGLTNNWQVSDTVTGRISNAVEGGTSLTVVNGASVNNTAPLVDLTPDHDRLIGGTGNDTVHGGAGNDIIYGNSEKVDAASPTFDLLGLNLQEASGQKIEGSVSGFSATQFTFEMLAAFDPAATGQQWFSNMPGNWYLMVDPNNQGLWLNLNGAWAYTQISWAELTSQGVHRISITWDSASGGLNVYLDGGLQSSTTFQQGVALTVAPSEAFSLNPRASIGDVRFFSDVRTSAEIRTSAFEPLAADTDSLVSHIVVDGLTGNVTDVVSGMGLTVTGTPATSTHVVWSDADMLVGGLGADWLYGGTDNDQLDGGADGDQLWGGAGADAHLGGDGIDYARYDDANYGNLTLSLDAPSLNTGVAVGDNYVSIEGLVGGVGRDMITGNASANYLFGADGDDFIYGQAGIDYLNGGGGGDHLWGGAGADQFLGGAGIDYARYDDAEYGNVTVRLDAPSLNTGVAAGDTFAEIEGLVGGAGNDIIVGNGEANYLFGANGDDMIYGQVGADYLSGGAGADHLWGGAGADYIIGGDGAGIDYARYDDGNWGNLVLRLDASSLNTGTAAAGDTYTGVEGLVGGTGNDVVIGNSDANYLFGAAGMDYMDGRLGNDYLNGGSGADRFRFSTALDGTSNVDRITDFAHAVDDLLLVTSIFSAIGAVLDAGELRIGILASDANDYLIYNQASGQLYYDADGSLAGSQTLFATFTAGTVLDINDFMIT